ncbi:MAG: hypothetical protein AAGJ37_03130 [Pseudomonadota bacterium]
MSVQAFINDKSKLVTHYVNGYWDSKITYDELQRFLWDTLEEWSEVDTKQFEAYTHQERIFWHIFQMLQQSENHMLSSEPICSEVECLLGYLNKEGLCPIDVVGMRP